MTQLLNLHPEIDGFLDIRWSDFCHLDNTQRSKVDLLLKRKPIPVLLSTSRPIVWNGRLITLSQQLGLSPIQSEAEEMRHIVRFQSTTLTTRLLDAVKVVLDRVEHAPVA